MEFLGLRDIKYPQIDNFPESYLTFYVESRREYSTS